MCWESSQIHSHLALDPVVKEQILLTGLVCTLIRLTMDEQIAKSLTVESHSTINSHSHSKVSLPAQIWVRRR